MAYPAHVRDCIKQAYEFGKEMYKDSFIIVNLDVPGFRLVMKRRTKEEKQWTQVKHGFRLPEECLDTSKRSGQQVRLIIDQPRTPRTPTRLASLGGRAEGGNIEDELIFHSPHNVSAGAMEGLENGDNASEDASKN